MKRLYVLFGVLAIVFVAKLLLKESYAAPEKQYASWTEFMQDVAQGKIRKLVVSGSSYSGEFADGIVPTGPDDPMHMRFRLDGPDWNDVSAEDKQAITTNILTVQPGI